MYKRQVIYGGLNYDMGTDAMARATSEYRDTDLAVSRTVSRGSLSLAEGMLPDENIYSETYHEAVNIAEMLRSCGVEPDLKTDDSGVAESFKALSGRQFELLHIATHGFYMPGHTEYQTSEELLSPMIDVYKRQPARAAISAAITAMPPAYCTAACFGAVPRIGAAQLCQE